jgi:hypothetical protein
MIPSSDILKQELEMEVIVSDDAAVYVKLTGFNDAETADTYATFLVDHLPLMLFESQVIH